MPLLTHGWNRYHDLHHLALRNVEARDSLGEEFDVPSHRLRSQHVGKVVRVEAPVLPVSEAEAVQIEIIEVREPNRRHAYLFGRLGGHREEGVAVADLILPGVNLDQSEA